MTKAAAALEWHDVAVNGDGKAIGAAIIRSGRLEQWIVGDRGTRSCHCVSLIVLCQVLLV